MAYYLLGRMGKAARGRLELIGMRQFRERILSVAAKLRSLIVPDSWKSLEKCDVLLYCHDVHRYFESEGRAYAPLLDSLAQDLTDEGWRVGRLASWGSVLSGEKAYGSPRSANRLFFLYFLVL